MKSLRKLLERQEKILERQNEISDRLQRLEEKINRNFDFHERAINSLDAQLALSNLKRENELSALKPTLEELQMLEEFLRLEIATRLMDAVDN